MLPPAQREWYRRLRRGDYGVFRDELARWGEEVTTPRLPVTIALCHSDTGMGMAVLYEAGWLSFYQAVARWSPLDALHVIALYCPSR
jgi:hypothetical protein